MAPKKATEESGSQTLPFGAGAIDASGSGGEGSEKKGAARDRAPARRRRRGSTRKRTEREDEGETPRPRSDDGAKEGRSGEARGDEAREAREEGGAPKQQRSGRSERRRRWQERRRGKKRGKGRESGGSATEAAGEGQGSTEDSAERQVEGMLVLERANHGHLRQREKDYLPTKNDVHVAPRLVQKLGLRDGSILKGTWRRGQGRHKRELAEVLEVDGRDPGSVRDVKAFKSLTSIDPDFHYAVGDQSGEVSLKVLDLICPIGRGQRGLIVAPPRSGKTILMQQFANAIEKIYPEVHLMVLLIDERPEEATEWKRTLTTGEVYVSTNDEMHKRHVELAEAVWTRCKRLVELGEDVVLLLDSITRLGRAYNNVHGNSGKTMSGGIDTRALERPKQLFGSARNTETAGSLTILGTTLIETGSRMDQVIFEEFKGTGNMELVLARRLADRRIFPAIDVERSGTRKEEKLISSRRLRLINTLRRVLSRMHWAEAMELLITKLDAVEATDEFLGRFEVDPEA